MLFGILTVTHLSLFSRPPTCSSVSYAGRLLFFYNTILANNMFNAWFAQTKTNEIKVQIFSDNVVLAKEYQKDTFVADCRDMFFTCSLFQICA